jgi:O-antigen/teichoic acid export membrane protein
MPPATVGQAGPSPSLRRSFSWALAGNVLYAACQWGILVALAKLGGAKAVGQYALGLAITAPIILFSNLQLREVQATDIRLRFRFGDYLTLRLLATAVALAAIGLFVGAFERHAETALVVILVGFAKSVDSIADMLFGMLQQREHMRPIAAAQAINGVVSLAAMAAALALTKSVVLAAVASSTGSAIALIATVVQARRVSGDWHALRPTWQPTVLATLARLSLPLGFVALLMSANANMPRYFVQRYFGEAELGVYSAMAYLVVAGTTVVGSLGQACSPRLAKLLAAGNINGFHRLLLKLLAIGSFLGACGIAVALAAGPQLLTLLYRPEFATASSALTWLMVAATLGYVATFLNTAMIVLRLFVAQAAVFALLAVVGFISCVMLVARYGLTGAAWATGLAYAVQLAAATLVVVRALATHPR